MLLSDLCITFLIVSNIGLLTITIILFSLVNLRGQMNEYSEQSVKRAKREDENLKIAEINEELKSKIKYLKGKINIIGKLSLYNIHLIFLSLIIILINFYFDNLFVYSILILFVVFSSLIMLISLYNFNPIYNFDPDKIIEKYVNKISRDKYSSLSDALIPEINQHPTTY